VIIDHGTDIDSLQNDTRGSTRCRWCLRACSAALETPTRRRLDDGDCCPNPN